ncbi:MAG: glutathione S-transferase family protein [Deltaproteobacteria bacterium]|nr:MAG: glutathione S-transferase family protein [Deltaproteobacteria bacterium]
MPYALALVPRPPCCFSRPLVYAPGIHVTRRRDKRMKVYDFVGAPNPKKLRVYLAEKGINIASQPVNIVTGENRQPEFLKKNPLGGLPVLELDDGSQLTESLTIMEYLEELNPKPPMIGTTPIERARVRELERICELGVLSSVAQVFQNTHPFMAGRLKQSPDAAENARNRLAANLKVVDTKIGDRPFVAGSRPSIADCTLFAALEFAEFAQVPLDPAFKNINRW